MKIAVEGCAHGDLENIYATLQHLEAKENIKIDLLICCGDFQATRNEDDLGCMACPDKYKSMCTFYKYYSGEELAPYLTLFVGGNHEASNYLWELYYGGWAAPRIYFLGFAGVVRFGGLRIGGISGIYKANHYLSGHYEQMPYNSNDMRSIYHIREYEVHKLMQIEEQLDIFISHDWPRGIAKFGNVKKLIHQKPFLEKEVTENTLGSKPGEILLNKLKPSFWFAAHLHTKYAALVQHDDNSFTKFLALDKCLPKRNFLQVIDIPTSEGPLEFHYDEEWLAITRAYNCFFPFGRAPSPLPPSQLLDLKNDKKWIQKRLLEKGHAVPTEFSVTVPPFNPNQARKTGAHSFSPPTGYVRNPFTLSFLQLLELPYLLDRTSECASIRAAQQHGSVSAQDPNEVVLDDEDDDDAVPDDVDEVEAEEEVAFQRRNGILSYEGES